MTNGVLGTSGGRRSSASSCWHAFVKLAFVVNSPMPFIVHQIWQQSNRAGLHMSAEKAGSSGSEAETKCVYMLSLDGTG